MQGMVWALGTLLLLWASALVLGSVAKRWAIPALVGEVLVGVVLGKSGIDLPIETDDALVSAVKELCLMLILFSAGLEFNLGLFKERNIQKRIAWVSFCNAFFPLVLGLALGVFAPHLFQDNTKDVTGLALVVGIAMMETAVPVLLKILMDMELLGTQVGNIMIASALLVDVLGWILLGIYFDSWSGAHLPILMMFVGMAVAQIKNNKKVSHAIHSLTQWVCGPVFFASLALSVNVVANISWVAFLVLFLGTVLSKQLGVQWAAKKTGMNTHDALIVSHGLCAQGAMGMLLAQMAFGQGRIQEGLFTSMIACALATTILAPIRMAWVKRHIVRISLNPPPPG